MAKAKKIVKSIAYTLELTQDEAETLHFLLNNVGGDPKYTRRQFTDNINRALGEAGVKDLTELVPKLKAMGPESIYFQHEFEGEKEF